jgi:YidC/Oxa1 family membrane protein insertase
VKDETKSLYAAIILSMLIIFGINRLFPTHGQETVQPEQNEVTIPQAVTEVAPQQAAEEALHVEDAPRVAFENGAVIGSVNLRGARFDDLRLSRYKQTLLADSDDVVLLSAAGSDEPYFAEFGWLGTDTAVPLPNAQTVWTAHSEKFGTDKPLVLTYDNGQGLRFIRTIGVDGNYLFTIRDRVENTTDGVVTLYPYGLISRTYNPNTVSGRSVVHEGISAVVDGSLKELKLKDLQDRTAETFEFSKGWAGFSDRYWFTALIPDADRASVLKTAQTADETYQVDFRGAPVEIAPDGTAELTTRFFAGAKEIRLLDTYAKKDGIDKFDLAVDFGWYYFLTKPFFYILTFLYELIGNMGWAILLFALLLRLAMFPIANKSYDSMSKMRKVQPKVQALQEQYGDNKMLLQQATMELYRREKINPASGCLPMFIQIPIFFSLYKVLNIAIEIRQAPFIGWIKDLSAPDPLTVSVWSHIPLPTFLNVGVWPILMGVTMWIQQKLNPAPANKDQARMFAMMPIIFTFMLGQFASGLVIYWTLSNILSILQQKAIMHKNGVK